MTQGDLPPPKAKQQRDTAGKGFDLLVHGQPGKPEIIEQNSGPLLPSVIHQTSPHSSFPDSS